MSRPEPYEATQAMLQTRARNNPAGPPPDPVSLSGALPKADTGPAGVNICENHRRWAAAHAVYPSPAKKMTEAQRQGSVHWEPTSTHLHTPAKLDLRTSNLHAG